MNRGLALQDSQAAGYPKPPNPLGLGSLGFQSPSLKKASSDFPESNSPAKLPYSLVEKLRFGKKDALSTALHRSALAHPGSLMLSS